MTLEVSGAALLNTTTEDRDVGHVFIVQPRATFEVGVLELRGDGRYWTKRFRPDAESNERIRGGGGDLGLQLGDLGTLRGGYRMERGDSRRASRRFDRTTRSLELEVDYGDRSQLTLELRREVRTFPERTVELDDVEQPTRDVKLVPSFRLRHRAFTGNELLLEWEYEQRRSNDLDRGYQGHRVSLGFRVPLWGPRRSSTGSSGHSARRRSIRSRRPCAPAWRGRAPAA